MGSLCTAYACQMGDMSRFMTVDRILSMGIPKEVSETDRPDFARMNLKAGRYNTNARIKVPQDSMIRYFFSVALGSAFKIIKKSQMISIRSRLTVTTSGDSDRE